MSTTMISLVGGSRTGRAGRLARQLGRVAERLATPLVPADYLDLFHPLRSGADLRGRVVAVEPETAEAATIVIRPGADWAGHVPGQYIRIGIDVDGVRRWRCYSLTSRTDRDDGCISVTVKTMPDGVVSRHLVRRTAPGTLVHLDQATGAFTLPAPAPAKALFVTAGSGVTPVMGMLRNALPSGVLRDVVLVHSAPSADDVLFAAELRELDARGDLRLVERHTDEAGVLTPSALGELVPDLAERETWACGPTAMLDDLEQHWAELGLADQLHTERFRPTVVAVGEGGTVTFSAGTGTGTALEADGAKPLLDVGEDADLVLPSGCRMGVCFGCVLPLKQGSVRDLRSGDVTTAEEGDHVLVQTCVSAAAGDCEVALTR